jgi:hypothetical protein
MPLAKKPDNGKQTQQSTWSKKTGNGKHTQQSNDSDLMLKERAALKEKAALKSFVARDMATSEVRLQPSGDPSRVGTNHANPAIGRALLMDALGTADKDFADGLISQLVRLNEYNGELNYGGLNFMFSVIKGLAPRDQFEAMLAAQMVAVHVNAMTIAKELKEAQTSVERESTERSLNKLSRTFISQLESLKRYRASGPQMVQNVSVAEGGQAIVANLSQPSAGKIDTSAASTGETPKTMTNVVPFDTGESTSAAPQRRKLKSER